MRLIDVDGDLISRSEAMGIVIRTSGDYEEAWDEIKRLPTIDPEKLRPTGRWEYTSSACDPFCAVYRCSYCGAEDENGFYYNYCPNCGAMMTED